MNPVPWEMLPENLIDVRMTLRDVEDVFFDHETFSPHPTLRVPDGDNDIRFGIRALNANPPLAFVVVDRMFGGAVNLHPILAVATRVTEEWQIPHRDRRRIFGIVKHWLAIRVWSTAMRFLSTSLINFLAGAHLSQEEYRQQDAEYAWSADANLNLRLLRDANDRANMLEAILDDWADVLQAQLEDVPAGVDFFNLFAWRERTQPMWGRMADSFHREALAILTANWHRQARSYRNRIGNFALLNQLGGGGMRDMQKLLHKTLYKD